MSCRENLEVYLRKNQVPFKTQRHSLAFTAQGVADSERISGQMMVKVVITIVDGEMIMLALPASRRVDLSRVRDMLGAQEVRLADEKEFVTIFPDCAIGAMPPFGNLYNIPVYIDESLTEDTTIFFQAGTHIETMSMAYADFARLVKPKVVAFALYRREIGAPSW